MQFVYLQEALLRAHVNDAAVNLVFAPAAFTRT